ncbi:hypothetical protein GN958_ATG00591 [Phytophthora infestans]|uniref:MULE transposase domain-containing protein n=1 Tax=Phytophthora infestans TaxID=4787 RepID=A0A8S9VB17_PHYIN|nr:hypothetical protein GN958_ATG00591 [Phytophthora infestans]
MDDLAPLADVENAYEAEGTAQRRRYAVLSTHGSKEEAIAAMMLRDGTTFRFLYNYGPFGSFSVYECSSHTNCMKFVRLVSSKDESGEILISLQSSGIHIGPELNGRKYGISVLVKREVDAILSGGAGPKKCLKILQENHVCNAAMLSILPTTAQLKNRKARLTKKDEGNLKITTPAALLEWSHGKMCKSAEAFYGQTPSDCTGEPSTLLSEETSFGIIFASRRIMLNIWRAVLGQERGGILAATDGLGMYAVATLTYRELFNIMRRFSKMLFNSDLKIRFRSLDHATCISSPFKEVWPDVTLLTCWPHFARKSREKARELLHDESYFEDVVYPHLKWLYHAKTRDQLAELVKLCVKKWKQDGHVAYADWFELTYVSPPWGSWFVGAAGSVQEILPSQNPLESYHRAIKKAAVNSLRANTATVLNSSLPGILRVSTMDQASITLRRYGEGLY